MTLWTFVFYAVLVSAWADCGCLTCSKHLKVVSPPNAPITVLHRGEACMCEKPMPFRIEIPHIVCKPCERKSYGYKVQTVRYVKQHDPALYQYGFDVEVPHVEKCPTQYFHGIAKTDRVVVPAVDECVPPPCNRNPCIEYLAPKCDSCDKFVYYKRQKRDLYDKYETEDMYVPRDLFSLKPVNWMELLTPKVIKPILVKNPWAQYLRNSFSAKYNIIEAPKLNLQENIARKHKSLDNSIVKDHNQDKPLRINIPLLPRKHFFPYGKAKSKHKLSPQTIREKRTEVNFTPSPKTIESKVFKRLVEKSCKFADLENVKITIPNLSRKERYGERSQRKRRKARGVALKDKNFPFYKISRSPEASINELPQDSDENLLEKERVELRKKYLKPFDVETIIPQNQVFYMLNTPIRMLSHIHKLREHVSPMVQSVPNVFDTSASYLVNLSKRFKRSAIELLREFMGNIGGVPRKMFLNLIPTRRNKRNVEDVLKLEPKQDLSLKTRSIKVGIVKENSAKKNSIPNSIIFNKTNRLSKRAIIKLVEDDDVHDFLKERLSIFASSEENTGNSGEDVLVPVLPEIKSKKENKKFNLIRKNKDEIVLQKLTPKLSFKNGKPFLDIEGSRKPFIVKKRKAFKQNEEDIQEVIDDVIEEARLQASNPRVMSHASEMPTQTVKTKINQILRNIQDLIEEDFEKHEEIYEELLKLQHLKQSVTQEWKHALIKNKQNDLNTKVNLLNKINEILSLKEDIIEMIGEVLSEGRNFNTNNLVKILIRLQKLQCLLVKVVENFAEGIRYQTPYDVELEIKQVDFLAKLNLVNEKTMVDLSASLRQERDLEVERQVEILNNLKGLLEIEILANKSNRINEVAVLLWELNNNEKLQKETILEMNDKMQYGLKLRKELKIIFDLEKQIEDCDKKLGNLLKDILKDKVGKPNRLKQDTAASKYGKILRKKPILTKNTLKKPLSLLKKRRTK